MEEEKKGKNVFDLNFEYEIEYGYDFSILVCSFHLIT